MATARWVPDGGCPRGGHSAALAASSLETVARRAGSGAARIALDGSWRPRLPCGTASGAVVAEVAGGATGDGGGAGGRARARVRHADVDRGGARRSRSHVRIRGNRRDPDWIW